MRQDFKGAVKDSSVPSVWRRIDPTRGSSQLHRRSLSGPLDDARSCEACRDRAKLNPYRDDISHRAPATCISPKIVTRIPHWSTKSHKAQPRLRQRFALRQAYYELRAVYAMHNLQFDSDPDGAPQTTSNLILWSQLRQQGHFEEFAITQCKAASVWMTSSHDAYAEMGYALADLGPNRRCHGDCIRPRGCRTGTVRHPQQLRLRGRSAQNGLCLCHKFFQLLDPIKTPVASLDTYLQTADASKTFTMKFQFDKQMERSEVENVMNWQIGRSSDIGPGTAYNFGLPVPETEVQPSPIPVNVYYDAEQMTATVYFNIRQNANADGTIDPSHIEFRFNGKDIFGLKMNSDFDQFNGFSRVY